MAHILIMPRQGNTVESCIITDWKVKEGEAVTPETIVCEVETDKASFEVPAGATGIVLKLLHEAGDDVPVLKPIAVIGAAGENWKVALSQENTRGIVLRVGTEAQNGEKLENRNEKLEKGTKGKTTDLNSSSLRVSVSLREINVDNSISPRAKNLAGKEALSLDKLSGTGPGGRIIERDVEAALQGRPPLTTAAKAAGQGAIPTVGYAAGSGLGGRITAADLAASSEDGPPYFTDPFTETPIKGIRKIIAERMSKSLAESAQFTLNSSAPASKLQEFRSGVKTQEILAEELGLSKITINDLILFAVARTIPRFPYMNAHKIGDTIRTFERLHLAVAVDTPRGLMVPVIRNADRLSLAQISSEAKRLAGACQNGTVNPDELSGSTFTVSNLGSLGVTSFTPVINAPEVAILGVCNIEMKPVAPPPGDCNSTVRFEPQIGFSLTINHEAVDGAPAARFLMALCDAVAHIDLLLAAG